MMRLPHFARRSWMAQKLPISISPQLCIFAAVLLLTVPLPWLLGWLLAVMIHELSHCIMLSLCGKRIEHVIFAINGAKIQTEALSNWQTLLCALAGPAGGLILLLLTDIFPQAALCSVLLSVYNLLPICPLDGGRAFLAFLRIFLSDETAAKTLMIVESFVLLALVMLLIVATFLWRLGILPLFVLILLIIRMHRIKRPCKTNTDRVQ